MRMNKREINKKLFKTIPDSIFYISSDIVLILSTHFYVFYIQK